MSNGISDFNAIDANSDGVITDKEMKNYLDAGNTITFTYNGEDYTMSKSGNKYVAHDSEDQIVDGSVQIENSLTVEGFVEVGISGVIPSGDRLYLGSTDGQETSMWIATCNLDGSNNTVENLEAVGTKIWSSNDYEGPSSRSGAGEEGDVFERFDALNQQLLGDTVEMVQRSNDKSIFQKLQ